MDERALITAAITGDQDAFAGLVRLHQARLRGLVALSLSERDDVLEVVQESFVDAWRALDRFDQTREFWPSWDRRLQPAQRPCTTHTWSRLKPAVPGGRP